MLFVAHNARTFDVPFLCNAFRRCGVDIPSDWLFKDTLPMGREAMKSEGQFVCVCMLHPVKMWLMRYLRL